MLPTLGLLRQSTLATHDDPALTVRHEIAQLVQDSPQYMQVFAGIPEEVTDQLASAVIEAPSLPELHRALEHLPRAVRDRLDDSDRLHVGSVPWRRALTWLWSNARPFAKDFTRLVLAGEVAKAVHKADHALGLAE